MHSADYALQDACLSVRASVRLTPAGTMSKRQDPQTFSPLGFFRTKTVWQYSDGDPLMGRLMKTLYLGNDTE